MNGGAYSHQEDKKMNFTEDDGDILTVISYKNKLVTFIDASEDLFENKENINEFIIYGIGDGDVHVAFNGNLFLRMVRESIDENASELGEYRAMTLPFIQLVKAGLCEAEEYLEEQEKHH